MTPRLWVAMLLFPFLTYSQEIQRSDIYEFDNELWTGIEFSKEINKKLDLALEEQLRLNDDFGSLKSFFTNVALQQRLHKYIRAGINYRFSIKELIDFHRITASLIFRYRKKPWTFTYRPKYQLEYGDQIPEKYFRNKLKIRYRVNKDINPFIATELFYNTAYRGRVGLFDKFRLQLGLNYRLKKRKELTVYYMYQQEINVNYPSISNVFGVFYSYSFKN
ncbi:MAG: DUF2490 domain-containing protein [Bacteroidetes bacterium]|nr:DUF2490 domain-containing protein [Bacteroidota bacterium]